MDLLTRAVAAALLAVSVTGSAAAQGAPSPATEGETYLVTLRAEGYATTEAPRVRVRIEMLGALPHSERRAQLDAAAQALDPEASWQLIGLGDFGPDGAPRVQADYEARIPAPRLDRLDPAAEALTTETLRATVQSVEYVPSQGDLDAVRQGLRDALTRAAYQEAARLSTVTGGGAWRVQTLDFTAPPPGDGGVQAPSAGASQPGGLPLPLLLTGSPGFGPGVAQGVPSAPVIIDPSQRRADDATGMPSFQPPPAGLSAADLPGGTPELLSDTVQRVTVELTAVFTRPAN